MSRIAIGLVAGVVVASSVGSAVFAQAPQVVQGQGGTTQSQVTLNVDPSIVTHGFATVKRAPDRAWFTLSTEVRDAKAADARQKSADIVTSLNASLKTAGLPPEAVRTTGFSLTPEMSYTGSVGQIKGYVVRNEIEVRVDEMDKLAAVIDAVNAPKGVGLSVVGPRFDLKNRDAAEQEVLRLAVENGLARAQAIASGARRNLGVILRIDEVATNTMLPTPRAMMARTTAGRAGGAGAAETETPISAGVIEVHAEVIVTVGIRF